jgi:hypothetical protein
LAKLYALHNVSRHGDANEYFALKERFMNDPAVRSLHASGNLAVHQNLRSVMDLMNRTYMPENRDFVPALNMLIDAVMLHAYEAKAGWEGTYEGLIGQSIGRKHRDALETFKAMPPSQSFYL